MPKEDTRLSRAASGSQWRQYDLRGAAFCQTVSVRHGRKDPYHGTADEDVDRTELDELLASYSRLTHQFELEGGYACRSEVVGVLKGLGFEEEDYFKKDRHIIRRTETCVAPQASAVVQPDIILLDEPTNHLDMESIAWLETYLINYKGAVFIVSPMTVIFWIAS